MADDGPPLGCIVTTVQGLKGVVRFKGRTSFADGKWFGIELHESKGKNNGSVQGIKYFTCPPNHGIFVKPSAIVETHGLEMEVPRPPPTTRPAHQRTPSTGGLLRSGSLNIKTGPPSEASTRSSSPARPLQKGHARSNSITKPPASPTKPVGISPLQPRKALLVRSGVSQDAPPSPRLGNMAPSATVPLTKRTSSPLSLPPVQFSPLPSSSPNPPSRPPTPPAPIPPPRDDTELQELRKKVGFLETRRAEEALRIRELQGRIEEAEEWVSHRPKIQNKLKSLQTELSDTRRELADAQQLAQLSESRMLDGQEQLEMVMLDKEVAEERAELAEAELEEVKEKLAIAEVELEVLQEEGKAAEDGPAKDSLAYIQLEKQNERLKDALIKLRDVTQDTESEQRRRINEMEKDISNYEELQASYDETLIKLSNAENNIEDLKLQLDDALGAEDMLVRLTERNLMLGEKIEEMRITIEDLEALKELSDELEENHVETEKQLHEDLEIRDTENREQQRKIESLEESCLDYESTIQQFRELVIQLQGELEQLRTQTQTAQTESATAASQAANVLSLNLKLQSSAQKNQARSIDLEVKSLEAKECRELLSIVQPYLPQLYVESDSDATSCYLFFRRLGYKTDLINNVAGQVHNLPDALNGDVSDTLVGVCEMRSRISAVSTFCKRFASILRRCDVETFLNMGRLYPEVAPLEKRIDMHIELLRRDEFRVMECVSDIAKIHAQFEHLADAYFANYETDLAEKELGSVISFDHDLDMFAAAIGMARTSITAITKEDDVVLDMGGYNIEQEFFGPLNGLLTRCKNAKTVSRKMIKRLEDLSQDSAAVKAHLLIQIHSLSNLSGELINFGFSLAQQILPHLKDVRSTRVHFQLTTILGVVKSCVTSTVGKDLKPGASPWEAVDSAIGHVIEESNKLVQPISESENVIKITGTAPWVARIAEIKAALAVNVEAERKVATLNDEIQALARNVRSKDQSNQESSVKIELMERRLEAAKKQADTIVELESELNKARKQERAYEEAMEQLHADLDTLDKENARLQTLTAGQERQANGPQVPEPENVAVEGSLETSYLLEQIEALRGTVRFLRMENSYLKGHDLLREIETLPPLVKPVVREPTPPLTVSGDSDSEDSDLDEPQPQPTLFSLSTETKKLYRDVMKFSSAPKVVDLSVLNAKRAEAKGGRVWMPKKQMPAYQVLERKMEGERLSRRVNGLLEKASALTASL